MPFAHNILKTLTMLIINWIEPGVYACDALKKIQLAIYGWPLGMTTDLKHWDMENILIPYIFTFDLNFNIS